jgi:hypothetical protein
MNKVKFFLIFLGVLFVLIFIKVIVIAASILFWLLKISLVAAIIAGGIYFFSHLKGKK